MLYQDYPPVDIVKKDGNDDEDANADKDGMGMMGFGGGEKKKKEEEKVEEVDNKEDSDEVSLTHLFKFRCDLTDGR